MIYILKKLAGNKRSVTEREAFVFYRDNAKNRDKRRFDEKKKLARILNQIYRKVQQYAIEYEGGVYAKNLFYLIPQECTKDTEFAKVLLKGGKQRITRNLHSDKKRYSLLFVPLVPTIDNRLWEMSYMFSELFKKKFSNFLFQHKQNYKFSLYSLLKARQ